MDKPVLDLVEFPPRSSDPEFEALAAANRFVMRVEKRLLWNVFSWADFIKPPD